MIDAPYLTSDNLAAIRRGDEPMPAGLTKRRKGANKRKLCKHDWKPDVSGYVCDKCEKRWSSKYGVSAPPERTWCGQQYDSKAEMRRAQELHLCLYDFGHTNLVIEQPRFQLGPGWRYVADFLVFDDGEFHAEDVKGKETPEFVKTRELWALYGPCELHVLTRTGTKWKREIIKGGNANWRATHAVQ